MSGRGWWSASMEKDWVPPGEVQLVLEYKALPPPDKALEEMRETLGRMADTGASIASRWKEWRANSDSRVQDNAWKKAHYEEMMDAGIHWYSSCKVFLGKLKVVMEMEEIE